MGGGIRTPDPRIRNPMLYPTELRPRVLTKVSHTHNLARLTLLTSIGIFNPMFPAQCFALPGGVGAPRLKSNQLSYAHVC